MSWCTQCSQWFHTVIHSIKTIFMYEEPPSIPPTVYMVNQTYYHPTSPTKRSYRNTENTDDFNIV